MDRPTSLTDEKETPDLFGASIPSRGVSLGHIEVTEDVDTHKGKRGTLLNTTWREVGHFRLYWDSPESDTFRAGV